MLFFFVAPTARAHGVSGANRFVPVSLPTATPTVGRGRGRHSRSRQKFVSGVYDASRQCTVFYHLGVFFSFFFFIFLVSGLYDASRQCTVFYHLVFFFFFHLSFSTRINYYII